MKVFKVGWRLSAGPVAIELCGVPMMQGVKKRSERPSRAAVISAASAFGIVIMFGLTMAVLQTRLAEFDRSQAALGVPFGYISLPLGFRTEAILAAATIIETALLAILYRSVRLMTIDGTSKSILAIACLLMLVISYRVHVTNTDVYHYVLYGDATSLGASYSSTPHPTYLPDQAGLAHVLSEPIAPSVYGPVWQAGDIAIVHATHSLAQAVQALRTVNIVAILAFFIALVALRLPPAILSVIVLNPALYYSYIVQGHNDIDGIAAIAIGLAIVRRYPYVAMALGALAGLVKITLLGPALATLCSFGPVRTRIGNAIGMIVVTIVVSLLLGGAPYAHAILSVGSEQGAVEPSRLQHAIRLSLQALLALVVLVAIAASIGYRRFVSSAVFAFPAISGLVHAWYMPWGITYAVLEERTAMIAALALPIIVLVTDPTTSHIHFTTLIFVIILAVAAYQIARRRFVQTLA